MYQTKSIAFLFFFLSGVAIVSAQDLKAVTTSLENQIGAVQTASKNFQTKLESQGSSLRYKTIAADQKGNSVETIYEFNLADIDPYAVKEVTQKDAIYCALTAKNKQKLIKVTKNNEVQPYDEQVSIIAKDIDNARAIKEAIQKGIPLAEKEVSGKLKLSGYDAMLTWLTANVKEVVVNSKTYSQTLSKGDKPGVVSLKQVEADGKSSQEETSVFNLADLNASTISYKVNGNRFGVEFETLQKNKFIGKSRNGEIKPYDNSVLIYTSNADGARDLKTVLSMIVPLASDKVKANLPAVANEKDGLNLIKSTTSEVNAAAKQITQTFSTDCVCSFTQVEKDAKSTETSVYKFNWMDFNPATNILTVSGERAYIDLSTNDKAKMVSLTKNEKFVGYDNAVRIYLPGIESSRRVKVAVDKVIEKCKANYKEPFGPDVKAALSWIKNNIADVSVEDVTVKQTLSPVEEGKLDKVKYTSRQISSKTTGPEEVFEFSFADVNPLSVAVDIKGKFLYVSFESAAKNKIFKYYKDGNIQPYTNQVEFAVPDTEKARQMVSAVKKAAKK